MLKPTPLPAGFDSGPFSVQFAKAHGISRSRLRASDLDAPIRGVRTRLPGNGDFAQRLAEYQVHMKPDECFSHITAAKLYGIPLPQLVSSAPELHVSVHAPAFPPRVRGVIGHRLFVPLSPRNFDGFPAVSPARTFTQLAGILHLGDLVAAGDDLVRRKHPLCTMSEIAQAVESMGRARGARAACLALPLIRPNTDSPMETRLRLLLIGAGLPEPVVGHTIRDLSGNFVATPDLAYVKERIAIEYEGSVHQTDPRVYANDIERRVRLASAGWFVILVISNHLQHPERVIEQVRAALVERSHLSPL